MNYAQEKRAAQARQKSVDRAVKFFREGTQNVDLTRPYRSTCIKRIGEAPQPMTRAKALVREFSGRQAMPKSEARTPLDVALDLLNACPAFHPRMDHRKDAILRVVKAAKLPVQCVQRIASGDQWQGMTWLPEAEGHEVVITETDKVDFDLSNLTEKLASAYRKNAPAMQEADLRSETPAAVKPPRVRLRTGYNPEAEFEPITEFLRRTKEHS